MIQVWKSRGITFGSRVAALGGLVALIGCGTASSAPHGIAYAPRSSSPSAIVSPAPSATTTVAAFIQNFAPYPPTPTYTINLVDTSGTLKATISPAVRTTRGGLQLPVVSASKTRLYYLDGDVGLRSITPDGDKAVLRDLDAPGGAMVTFAISPDDRRIAISTFTGTFLGQVKVTMDMYVEDLAGGNRVDLLSSSSTYEWPVGWQGDSLIVAVSPIFYQQNYAELFMRPLSEVHVVDSHTGDRLATVRTGADLRNFYPVFSAGLDCTYTPASSDKHEAHGWDGKVLWTIGQTNGCSLYGALSPDALTFAQASGDGCQLGLGSSPVKLLRADGGSPGDAATNGIPVAWLDQGHFVVQKSDQSLSIYSVQERTTVGLASYGFVGAVVPSQ